MVATFWAQLVPMDSNTLNEAVSSHLRRDYYFSQPLHTLSNMPLLPERAYTVPNPPRGPHPVPHPWTPKFIPKNWIYTNGSEIKGQPWLGAAVVHTPNRTTIYILDAAGAKKPRTITRAEPVTIHTALTTFTSHDWLGIFTDHVSNLYAIRHHNTIFDTHSSLHYHHYMLLLGSITDLLETTRSAGLGKQPTQN
jgi:hypothetical protein